MFDRATFEEKNLPSKERKIMHLIPDMPVFSIYIFEHICSVPWWNGFLDFFRDTRHVCLLSFCFLSKFFLFHFRFFLLHFICFRLLSIFVCSLMILILDDWWLGSRLRWEIPDTRQQAFTELRRKISRSKNLVLKF